MDPTQTLADFLESCRDWDIFRQRRDIRNGPELAEECHTQAQCLLVAMLQWVEKGGTLPNLDDPRIKSLFVVMGGGGD